MNWSHLGSRGDDDVYDYVEVEGTDQFLHRGVGEDPVEGGEGEGGEQADVDLVT